MIRQAITCHRMGWGRMILIVAVAATPLSADVFQPTGPFGGEASEGFEGFTTGSYPSMNVLGQQVTINNLTEGGSLKIELSSSLNGNLVTPRSGARMGGQLGIAEWIFHVPPASFGGYFATNSGADDGVVTFFGAQDQVLGQTILTAVNTGNIWTWNGWTFSAPIHRLEIDGNGLIDGFIWYDDMQYSAIPEPATAAILIVLVALSRRRRRSGDPRTEAGSFSPG